MSQCHRAAIAIAGVGHYNVPSLQLVVSEVLTTVAVSNCDVAQAPCQEVVCNVQAPLVSRASWVAQGGGIHKQDALVWALLLVLVLPLLLLVLPLLIWRWRWRWSRKDFTKQP